MSLQDNNQTSPDPQQRAARLKLIMRLQLIGVAVAAGIVFASMRSQPGGENNAFLPMVAGIIVVTGIVTHFVLRAALGKIKDQPEAMQKLFVQKKARPISPLMFLIIFGMVGSLGTLNMYTNPMRIFETFLLAALIVSPFVFGFGMWMLQGNPIWPFLLRKDENPDENSIPGVNALWFVRLQLGISACVMAACLLLVLNAYLDHSPASIQSYTIINKYTTYNKGREYYHLQFMSPVPSPISVLDFGGKEKLPVLYDAYRTVVPGTTQVNLNMHPGFFHWPWYESRYSFTNPR